LAVGHSGWIDGAGKYRWMIIYNRDLRLSSLGLVYNEKVPPLTILTRFIDYGTVLVSSHLNCDHFPEAKSRTTTD